MGWDGASCITDQRGCDVQNEVFSVISWISCWSNGWMCCIAVFIRSQAREGELREGMGCCCLMSMSWRSREALLGFIALRCISRDRPARTPKSTHRNQLTHLTYSSTWTAANIPYSPPLLYESPSRNTPSSTQPNSIQRNRYLEQSKRWTHINLKAGVSCSEMKGNRRIRGFEVSWYVLT